MIKSNLLLKMQKEHIKRIDQEIRRLHQLKRQVRVADFYESRQLSESERDSDSDNFGFPYPKQHRQRTAMKSKKNFLSGEEQFFPYVDSYRDNERKKTWDKQMHLKSRRHSQSIRPHIYKLQNIFNHRSVERPNKFRMVSHGNRRQRSHFRNEPLDAFNRMFSRRRGRTCISSSTSGKSLARSVESCLSSYHSQPKKGVHAFMEMQPTSLSNKSRTSDRQSPCHLQTSSLSSDDEMNVDEQAQSGQNCELLGDVNGALTQKKLSSKLSASDKKLGTLEDTDQGRNGDGKLNLSHNFQQENNYYNQLIRDLLAMDSINQSDDKISQLNKLLLDISGQKNQESKFYCQLFHKRIVAIITTKERPFYQLFVSRNSNGKNTGGQVTSSDGQSAQENALQMLNNLFLVRTEYCMSDQLSQDLKKNRMVYNQIHISNSKLQNCLQKTKTFRLTKYKGVQAEYLIEPELKSLKDVTQGHNVMWISGHSLLQRKQSRCTKLLVDFCSNHVTSQDRQNNKEDEMMNESTPEQKSSEKISSANSRTQQDRQVLKIESVIATTNHLSYTQIGHDDHPDFIWQQGCIDVINVLANLRKLEFIIGVKFTVYESVLNYRKIDKHKNILEYILGPRVKFGSTLTDLLDRIHDGSIENPFQFWYELGLIFKTYLLIDPDERSTLHQYCQIMRTIALHLFKKWEFEVYGDDNEGKFPDKFLHNHILKKPKLFADTVDLSHCNSQSDNNGGMSLNIGNLNQLNQLKDTRLNETDRNKMLNQMIHSLVKTELLIKNLENELNMKPNNFNSTFKQIMQEQQLFKQMLPQILLQKRDSSKQSSTSSEQNNLKMFLQPTGSDIKFGVSSKTTSNEAVRQRLLSQISGQQLAQFKQENPGTSVQQRQLDHAEETNKLKSLIKVGGQDQNLLQGASSNVSNNLQSSVPNGQNQENCKKIQKLLEFFIENEKRNNYTNVLQETLKSNDMEKLDVIRKIPHNRDLFWILFGFEEEEDVAKNIYIEKEDIADLISKVKFFNQDESIENSQYYSNSEKETDQSTLFEDSYVSEPLFLVKWQDLPYSEASWEPLSLLNRVCLQKIKRFIKRKKYSNSEFNIRRVDYICSFYDSLHQLVQNELKGMDQMQVFAQAKHALDSFIWSQLNLVSSKKGLGKDEEIFNYYLRKLTKTKKMQFRDPSFSLVKIQLQSLEKLVKAFLNNQNVILADEIGFGKTITLISFLHQIHTKTKIQGPFLVVTSEKNLQHWKSTSNKLTCMKSLIYHFDDSDEELGQIQKFYFLIDTQKPFSDMDSQQNRKNFFKQMPFNLLITTPKALQRDKNFITRIPFLHIIVDEAHIAEHLNCIQPLLCKRITLSTPYPLQPNHSALFGTLANINPQLLLSHEYGSHNHYNHLTHSHIRQAFLQPVKSLAQLSQMATVVKNHVIRHDFNEMMDLMVVRRDQNNNSKHEQVPLLQVTEVLTSLTIPQQLFIFELYRRNKELLKCLSHVETLTTSQESQLMFLDDQLMKCCTDLALVDPAIGKIADKSMSRFKQTTKNYLMSGKLPVLINLIKSLEVKGQKLILCTKYQEIVVQFRQIAKQKGIACFSYQANTNFDNVYRFNLFQGSAVFVLNLTTTKDMDQNQLFDLDLVHNVAFFDSLGDTTTDMQFLLSRTRFNFSSSFQVYRFLAKDSYEHKNYLLNARNQISQGLLFQNGNFWESAGFLLNDSNKNFQHEYQIQMKSFQSKMFSFLLKSVKDLDYIFRLSGEAVLNFAENLNHIEDYFHFKNFKVQNCFSQNLSTFLSQTSEPLILNKLNKVSDLKECCEQVNDSDPEKIYKRLTAIYRSDYPLLVSGLNEPNFYDQLLSNHNFPSLKSIKSQNCVDKQCVNIFDNKHGVDPENGKKYTSETNQIIQSLPRISMVRLIVSRKQIQNFRNTFDLSDASQTSVQQQYSALIQTQPTINQFKEQRQASFFNNFATTSHLDDKMKFKEILKQKRNANLQEASQNLKRVKGINDFNLADFFAKKEKQESETNKPLEEFNSNQQSQNPRLHSAINGSLQDTFTSKSAVRGKEASKLSIDKGTSLSKSIKLNENQLINTQKSKFKKSSVVIDKTYFNINGHICSVCLMVIPDQNQPGIVKCSGFCMRIMHATCAEAASLLAPLSSHLGKNQSSSNPDSSENAENKADSHDKNNQILKSMNAQFVCTWCQKEIGQCYLCGKNSFIKSDNHNDQQLDGNNHRNETKRNTQKALMDSATNENWGDTTQPSHMLGQTGGSSGHLTNKPKSNDDNNTSSRSPPDNMNNQAASSGQELKGEGTSEQDENSGGLLGNNNNTTANHGGSKGQQEGDILKNHHQTHTSQEEFQLNIDITSDEYLIECVVGSCSKFYHTSCLKGNQNIDSYLNNRNQQKYRCPHHYCSGCGISGNSVQILQCIKCPTSYHIKCLKADTEAIKLTKKYILCGQHSYLYPMRGEYNQLLML